MFANLGIEKDDVVGEGLDQGIKGDEEEKKRNMGIVGGISTALARAKEKQRI